MSNNEIMTVSNLPTVPTFTNKALNQATAKILKIADTMRRSSYEAAAVLAKVDETECYKDDGFKSAADYAMQTFGLKKSAAYNMIKVGKEFTDRQKLTSNLPHDDTDFTTSQVVEMFRVERDEAVKLIEGGEINPAMTCKEIRDKLTDYLSAPATVEGEVSEGDENAEGENSATAENPEAVYKVHILGDWHEERDKTLTTSQIDELKNQANFFKEFKAPDKKKRIYMESGEEIIVVIIE